MLIQQHYQRGSSLSETLVALALIMIGVTSLLSLQLKSTQRFYESRHLELSGILARNTYDSYLVIHNTQTAHHPVILNANINQQHYSIQIAAQHITVIAQQPHRTQHYQIR